MGLLDFINTPEGQGLLAAGFGGLAGARRGQPINSIGRAGLAGLAGYAGAQDQQAQAAERAFKTQQQARERQNWEKSDKIDALASQFYSAGAPGADPSASPQASKFDAQGYTNALMGLDPMKGVAFAQSQAKDSQFGKVDPKDYTPESVQRFAQSRSFGDLVPRSKSEVAPNGMVYDPYNVKPGSVFADPNKPFSVGAGGALMPNTPFQQFELSRAKSSAPNVNVKTDVKMGESLGAQVGPMMKDSTAIAEGAVKQVDAAQRISRAIDTNQVYAGPGAGVRLKVGQVSQMLGVGGKDEAEKIANTRSTVRGLAELTLQGRQQMKGQGAITESEGALAEKAMSGRVEDLTGAEIKQLAKASERAARFNYGEHQRKLKVMQSNPSLQNIAPFYEGPAMPTENAPSSPAATGGADYRFENGKLVKVK